MNAGAQQMENNNGIMSASSQQTNPTQDTTGLNNAMASFGAPQMSNMPMAPVPVQQPGSMMGAIPSGMNTMGMLNPMQMQQMLQLQQQLLQMQRGYANMRPTSAQAQPVS